MSASKSSYPERPPFPRPKKPGKGMGRPSTHKGGKKSRVWFEKAVPQTENKQRETFDKLDESRCSYGHRAVIGFLKQHVYNRVPVKVWGKHDQHVML